MSIKGLTDRPAQFPEIGQIRKGAPKEPNKPGADLQYFRAEFDEREIKSAQVFRAAYRDQPAELNILLPFNEIDRQWEAWKEAYVAGAMIHRCDGQRIMYQIDYRTGQRMILNGEPERGCNYSRENPIIAGKAPVYCRPVGRLKVIIPELERLAYLTVHTTSVHDILNISRQLEALQATNRGRLAGIPLKLRRRPVEISTPGPEGKRVRRIKWLLSIEADPEWVRQMLTEMKRLALPGNGLPLGLPDPERITINDEAEEGEWDEIAFKAGEEPAEGAESLELAPEFAPIPAPPPAVAPLAARSPAQEEIGATEYYTAAFAAGLDRKAAVALVNRHGLDYAAALTALAGTR